VPGRVVESLLAPLVQSGARLLRVEASGPHALVLRFDRGALEVAVAGRGLELELAPPSLPELEAEVLDETDPWWTVIGEPLTGAWSTTDTEGRRTALELELRRQSPKRILLDPRDPRGRSLT
jgi:hypothetical protein